MRVPTTARLALLCLILTLVATVPPARAAYGRNGPYLDYATMPSIGPSGRIPLAHYTFGTYPNPVTVAQYGLQAAANYSVTRRRAYRADALRAARWLVRRQAQNGGWRYEFGFTVAGFPPLEPGWISGMAQGQALSLLWRAHRILPRRAYRRAALKALRPFRRSTRAGGVVGNFDGVAWYEEYPTRPDSHVLNGYLFALLGLYDVAPWSRTAAILFRRGVASLRSRIDRFDRPGGSYYLPGQPASAYYNRVHVVLLGAIHSVRPAPVLKKYRGRWWQWTVR